MKEVLYDSTRDVDLLDKQIAKHFNFNVEEIDAVYYLNKEHVKKLDGLVVLD